MSRTKKESLQYAAVIIHIPPNVPEAVKKQKINNIYDILSKSKKIVEKD